VRGLRFSRPLRRERIETEKAKAILDFTKGFSRPLRRERIETPGVAKYQLTGWFLPASASGAD